MTAKVKESVVHYPRAACCGGEAAALADYFSEGAAGDFGGSDPEAFITKDADGNSLLHLLVENMHCANCIRNIENSFSAFDDVIEARVNFSTHRLLVRWRPGSQGAEALLRPVLKQGYRLVPFDPQLMRSAAAEADKFLLRCIAVAGFAAANVMLLSVSVWAGMFSADMGSATRDLMHWLSALVALPAVAYAGRPFFRSAFGALLGGRMNMDVPISLAVLMAAGMSLLETMQHGEYVYFDASVTLLFLLLIGRYLDRKARTKARSAAERLLLLKAVAATVINDDGQHKSVPVDSVTPDCQLFVAAGDRVPVDGVITGETGSNLDSSLVTGESLPQAVVPGDEIYAGTLNLGRPFQMRATKVGDNTLLGAIVRLMETAEQGRARYVRLADRVAEFYAPAVHLLAAATFVGWWLLGAHWQVALLQAVAVLIVTCPCALGLAVPVVQVIASGLLLKKGIFVKSADGLERLAEIDTIVLDKTGTLTRGRPELLNGSDIAKADLAIGATMARHSRHPLAQALVRSAGPLDAGSDHDIDEQPGMGLEWRQDGARFRLGNREWCRIDAPEDDTNRASEIWLSDGKGPGIQFRFADKLRDDAHDFIARMTAAGMEIELLSGDRQAVVEDVAAELGIKRWQAAMKPDEKVARLQQLAEDGRKVLMVGDGLNDAPALAAAHVSMSPGSASDISQSASDFVFQAGHLLHVHEAWRVARFSKRLILQNFGLAFGYNLIAVPLAVAGLVTPLIAAVAMSASSLVVTGNSLRLRRGAREES